MHTLLHVLNVMRVLFVLTLLLALTACGLKGDLVIVEPDNEAASEQPAE